MEALRPPVDEPRSDRPGRVGLDAEGEGRRSGAACCGEYPNRGGAAITAELARSHWVTAEGGAPAVS